MGGQSQATVLLPDNYLAPATAQNIIDLFKSYVDSANMKFRQNLENESRQREEARRRDLQQQIAAEERRQRILGPLRV